jgi:hypothetical protein
MLRIRIEDSKSGGGVTSPAGVPFHERLVCGIELEGYTILLPGHAISRKMAFHRKGTAEKGERFGRDSSIGTEYNSRPFSTLREGFFLLKAGLRKYNTSLYRTKTVPRAGRRVFLVGGWRDRFAGAHVHFSIAGKKLERGEARRLAWHLHDHIPLFVAMAANSPVWADAITPHASNRVLKGTKAYFRPIARDALRSRPYDEMTLSRGRKTKPPTLELRVMDSNIPEYVLAVTALAKACLLACLRGEKASNRVSHYRYLRGRLDAARHGMRARLCWNGEWITAPEYLDRFIWVYRKELKEMDVPHEIWETFKYLKRGANGSMILGKAAREAYGEHPQTWQSRFAKRYTAAIDALLSGRTLSEFMRRLNVKPPSVKDTWLGRRKLKLL